MSFICECFIFLYLGLGLLSFGEKAVYDTLYILAACLSILISRTHVFIISFIANLFPSNPKIPFKHQLLMWFSGLRGAVAFALGVTFLELPTFSKSTKGIIFGTTVMVVVLTVLILGSLTPYMLIWLGISSPDENDHDSIKPVPEDDEPNPESYLNKPFFGWLYNIDAV
jgi:NhaP-type Na+/H+ or K+/H+ antiporter